MGTLYAARVVGASGLGTYFLFIAVVSFSSTFIRFGIGGATTKRISEGKEQGQFFSASFLMSLSLFFVVSLLLLLLKPEVIDYIGTKAGYYLVFPALFLVVFRGTISSGLSGERKVGRQRFLSFSQNTSRVIVWIIILSLGLGFIGLVSGYLIGLVSAILLGTYFLSIKPEFPSKRHFKSIFSFSKYSWLGSIRGTAWNWTDTFVLGLFVSSSYVGIYKVAWSVSGLFYFVAMAIGSTLFPNISKLASEGKTREVEDILEESMTYVGVLAIPGLIGAILLGKPVLGIYGKEFGIGYFVLIILVFARLLHCYETGLTSTISGLDRPDLMFRVHGAFLSLNVVGNFLLIYWVGWVGAAVATTSSMATSLVLSISYVNRLLELRVHLRNIFHEIFSALIMGIIIYFGLNLFKSLTAFTTIFLVLIGAVTYLTTLLLINKEIREKILNLTDEIIGSMV